MRLAKELQDALDNEQPRKAPRLKNSALPALPFLWCQYLRNSSGSTSPEQKHGLWGCFGTWVALQMFHLLGKSVGDKSRS